jgi:hypothetical protein
MEKGAKIGLAIGIGVVVIATGVGIYYAMKPSETTSGNLGVGSGSGGGSGSNTGGNSGPFGNIDITKIKDLAGQLIALTEEKFPMRVGMKGAKVKALQTALRDKFHQLDVATDGIFGIKTWNALKAIGYVTLVNSSLGEGDYNKVLEGKRPDGTIPTGFGASGRGGGMIGGDFGSSTIISI